MNVAGPPTNDDLAKLRKGEITSAVWAFLGDDPDRRVDDLAKQLAGKILTDQELAVERQTVLALLAAGGVVNEDQTRLRRFLVDALLLAAVLISAIVVAANWDRFGRSPGASSDKQLNGVQAAASREFEVGSPGPSGTRHIVVGVAELDTPEHADEAMAGIRERLQKSPDDPAAADYSQLQATSLAPIRGETVALTGKAKLAGVTLDVAFLFVRDGKSLYVMQGVGLGVDPLAEIVAVAQRLFDPEQFPPAPAPPGVAYRTGGLWDTLPRLEHLPAGFVLGDQHERLNDALADVT